MFPGRSGVEHVSQSDEMASQPGKISHRGVLLPTNAFFPGLNSYSVFIPWLKASCPCVAKKLKDHPNHLQTALIDGKQPHSWIGAHTYMSKGAICTLQLAPSGSQSQLLFLRPTGESAGCLIYSKPSIKDRVIVNPLPWFLCCDRETGAGLMCAKAVENHVNSKAG